MIRVVVVLIALALSAPAQVLASHDTHERSPRAASSSMWVRLKVAGCNHCVVQLTNYSRLQQGDPWLTVRKRVGKEGFVKYWVPKARARGMFIEIYSNRWDAMNAQNLVAMRHRGKKPGARTSAKYAARSKRATPCWAGSRRKTHTFRIRVVPFKARRADGSAGRSFRAWTTRAQRSKPPMLRTWRGAIGSQAPVECGR